MDLKPRTEKTKNEKRIIYLQIAKTRVLKDHNVATTALMEYEIKRSGRQFDIC